MLAAAPAAAAPPGDTPPMNRWQRPAHDRFAVGAAGQLAIADDGSTWMGVAGSICKRWRSICLGLRLDAMWDGERPVNLTRVARRDLGLLASGTKSAPLGPGHAALEVGAGVGFATTWRVEDPDAPPTASVVYVGDGFSRTSISPRLTTAVRAAFPLPGTDWLDLDLRAGVTLAPLAHHTRYGPAVDFTTETMIPASAVELPGDPVIRLELAVGLRVGMP